MKKIFNIKNLKYGMSLPYIFLALSFGLFYVSFQSNALNWADESHFEKFANGTEAFVVNRVALSEKFGSDSFAGMVGRIPELDNLATAPVKLYRGRSLITNYYQKFQGYLTEQNFKPYYSNMAVQGRFMSWLNNNKILTPGQNFNNYRIVFSLIASLVFMLLVRQVVKNFGLGIGAITLIGILQLDWIIASASHFFWFLALMFLPFVLNWILLNRNSKKRLLITLFVMNLMFSFLKCVTSGFEVIPTFLVLNTLPVFYYFVVFKWKILWVGLIFSSICLGSLIGVGGSIWYQVQKINQVAKSSDAGIEHLKSSFFRRSGSKDRVKPHMPDRIKQSYGVSSIEVIQKYLPFEVSNFSFLNTRWGIKAIHLIKFLFGASLLMMLLALLRINLWSKEAWGMLLMTWVSLIGPLSMFVVFKSLSYLHPHLVPITWSMPFAILMIILICLMIRDIFSFLIKQFFRKTDRAYIESPSLDL